MISHQLSAAAACDRILVLNEGKLVQEGTHENLIKINGIYKNLWERQKASEAIETEQNFSIYPIYCIIINMTICVYQSMLKFV